MNEKGNIALCLFDELENALKYVEQARKCIRLLAKEQDRPGSSQVYKNMLSKDMERCSEEFVVQKRLDRFYDLKKVFDGLANSLSDEVGRKVWPTANTIYTLQEKWAKYYNALYGLSPQYF